MKRHMGTPEGHPPSDLESSGKVSMLPHNIQPFQAHGHSQERKVGKMDAESMKKVAAAVGGIWVLGNSETKHPT